MTYLLNLILILSVLLIAYWWANQGLLSSLLHLICVIVAGTIAFAFWEPLVAGLLLRGNAFDNYAWGIGLIALFLGSLLALRLPLDRLVHANIRVPEWANLTFGFVLGIGSGILTMGIFMIGAGHIQTHKLVFDYQGFGRDFRTGRIEPVGPQLWIPVDRMANGFFEYVSVGALHPTFSGTPLKQVNPDLYKQASLLRDSYDDGKGMFSLVPDAAEVRSFQIDEGTNRHFVEVRFDTLARDWGEMLTLSPSQVRLICYPRPRNSTGAPEVLHPSHWSQQVSSDSSDFGRFGFDDPFHYVTSVPGQESARAIFEFEVPQGHTGRYIQIRGTRFALPRPDAERGIASTPTRDQDTAATVTPGAGQSIQESLSVNNDIRPVTVSVNRLPGSMREVDRYLTEGHAQFQSSRDRVAPNLRIRGIHEPAGTRIVKLDVSRGTPADLFGAIRSQLPRDGRMALVDANGNRYTPIGYMHMQGAGNTTIRLDPSRLIPNVEQLPMLPSSGRHELYLVFQVTRGVTITGFNVGDLTIGTANLEVR